MKAGTTAGKSGRCSSWNQSRKAKGREKGEIPGFTLLRSSVPQVSPISETQPESALHWSLGNTACRNEPLYSAGQET